MPRYNSCKIVLAILFGFVMGMRYQFILIVIYYIENFSVVPSMHGHVRDTIICDVVSGSVALVIQPLHDVWPMRTGSKHDTTLFDVEIEQKNVLTLIDSKKCSCIVSNSRVL